MLYVGFLQNAWSPLYAGDIWPRDSWLRALWRSRSGQRLKVFQDLPIWWDNTTPIVGETPDSIILPDYNHMKQVLKVQKPKVVLTFGKQAASAIKIIGFNPTVLLPHPAWRVLKNEVYQNARRILINSGNTYN